MSRHRSAPRISISKLAEYIVAPPGRRRTLLRDQKYPSTFIVSKFREAYPALVDVMLHGGDVRLLDRYVAEWRGRKPSSPFEAENLQLCIEALCAFRPRLLDGTFKKLSFESGRSEAYLPIGGVNVSVRPDLLIPGDETGALKFYLVKSTPLTPDLPHKPGSSSHASSMLHHWVENEFGDADPRRCKIVDVFAGVVYTAPARYTKRRDDAQAACEELALVWPAIKDPRASKSAA